MGEVMKTLAACVFAVVLSASATAEPGRAGVWLGFDGSEDGFLLNMDTSEAWMTGICLRQISDLTGQGTLWKSDNDTVEMVGRTPVRLRQIFNFDLSETPRLTVTNPDRGGAQSFDVVIRPCPASAICQAVSQQPVCQD